ncbi:transposase [Catalinimonas locisalis]|uniref:transposase n=1 Tax=Catalinimonas locisalis TaxID=3133978 RepID=UPI00403F866D
MAIDPVIFFKFMLIGYLENLNSDRAIIRTSELRLDILYFLGYNLDGPRGMRTCLGIAHCHVLGNVFRVKSLRNALSRY